jgi:hypothetical protein
LNGRTTGEQVKGVLDAIDEDAVRIAWPENAKRYAVVDNPGRESKDQTPVRPHDCDA